MPTIDNTGQSAGALSTSSLSISSFAVGSGPNRLIKLEVSQYKATDTAPTATFNTTENFAVLDQQTIAESPGVRRVTVLYLLAPSNVTAAINVQWGGASANEAVIMATSWSDVDQATPFGTPVKTSSASAATSTVNVPNNVGEVVTSAISADAQGASPVMTGNRTVRVQVIAGSNTTEGAVQTTAGTGSTLAMTFSNIASGGGTSAHIGVVIKAAAAAALPDAPRLANPMRPFNGIIGKVAMALRTVRPPAQTAPGSVTITATGISTSYSFSLGAGAALASAIGASSSASTGVGQGAALATAQGASLGTSSSQGAPAATASATGNSMSPSTAAAAGSATGSASGNSLSSSAGVGAGAATAAGAGASLSESTAVGTSSSSVTATGNGSTLSPSTAVGQGSAVAVANGISASPSRAVGAPSSVASSTGRAATVSLASGIGAAIAVSAGFSASVAVSAGVGAAVAAAVGFCLAISRAFGTTAPAHVVIHLDEPLSIDFDALAKAIDFTSLARAIDFDTYAKVIGFHDGGTLVFELTITQGEIEPIAMTLQGADPDTGVLEAYDVSAATTLTFTAARKNAGPIMAAKPLTKVSGGADGRVTFTPSAGETAVAGRYEAMVVAAFASSVVRKFPGRLTITDAIA